MILLQNPNMPVPTNAVEIDAAILDVKAKLESGLTWLTNGYGRTYKNLDARNGTTVFYPEAYLGEQNNSHRYINLSPDNDKQGQCFFYVVRENITQFQPGMYSFLSYDTAIIFSVNMELIDDALLQTEIYQQILVAQVRDVLTRQLLGADYQLTVTSVDFLFETVFAEFDLADAQQLEKAPLSHFRFNVTIQLPEECPAPSLIPIPPPPMVDMSLWLKGDAGVNSGTAVNGDPVSIWADQSGKGNDFTQSTFINQPTFIESGVNGQKGLNFTSPNILVRLNANFFLANEGVVFVVVKKNAPSTGGVFSQFLALNTTGPINVDTNYMLFYANDTGLPTSSYWINMFNNNLDLDLGLSGTDAALLTVKKTNTDIEGKRDGNIVDTGTGTQGLGRDSYHSIGQWFNSSRTLEGEIYEIIIYEALISDADIITVENYLKNKYAIT
jgi:hypothetical protein